MALHSLYCADVPWRNCSLTHPRTNFIGRRERQSRSTDSMDPSSVACGTCKPMAWMFRHTACPKWNAHPRWTTTGRTSLMVAHTADSKSIMTTCTHGLVARTTWLP